MYGWGRKVASEPWGDIRVCPTCGMGSTVLAGPNGSIMVEHDGRTFDIPADVLRRAGDMTRELQAAMQQGYKQCYKQCEDSSDFFPPQESIEELLAQLERIENV